MQLAKMGSLSTDQDKELAPLATENEPLVTTNGAYGSVEEGRRNVAIQENGGVSKSERMRRQLEARVLVKTQSSFWEDAAYFRDGSIPHSMVLATVIGGVCGTAAFVYYKILFWILEFVWHTLPQMIVVDKWPEWTYVLWIPLVAFIMAIGVGLTVVYMGEPGGKF